MTSCSMVSGKRKTNRRASGFTLIELMIAMLLGLIVIAGVISVFLANQRVYRTNEALGEVQDGTRIAFELMAQDIRNAGLNGCNNNGRVANVLNNGPNGTGTQDWWADWGNAVHGYSGTQVDPAVTIGTTTGTRFAGTDSLTLLGAADSGLSVDSSNVNAASFKLNQKPVDLNVGDAIIVCDPDHATIMQITGPNSISSGANVTVVHNTGAGSPGNCSKGMGFPTVCTTNGTPYAFGSNSQMFKLAAVDWYIGNNGAGNSLFRQDVQTNAGSPVATAQEMVRGVTAMTIAYHQAGAATFVLPAAVADWSRVDAVRVTLTLQSADQSAGTDVKPIKRSFTATTTVRNRVN